MKYLRIIPALIVVVALLLGGWQLYRWSASMHRTVEPFAPPAQLVPFRTPGGKLHTNGFTKTETLHKETGSWRGTTASSIRVSATYRYEIELRERWNLLIDDTRKVAFVVAPAFKTQLPVAVDSRTVEERTSSGWGRFDKWESLHALRKETSPYLGRKAVSPGYMEVARGQARLTVEEFVADWLLRNRGWPEHSERFVKVYFADEEIPFPENKGLKDFLP
jgi:hypothetical protein